MLKIFTKKILPVPLVPEKGIEKKFKKKFKKFEGNLKKI
jgi:hypothetical protein